MSSNNSRREFLKRASALSATGLAAPWALNLAAIGDAAARANPSDYKALVCVFLFGGNDHGNTLVPYDLPTHTTYASLRGGLGTDRTLLGPTLLEPATPLAGGRQYALAPALAPLKRVFDKKRLAVLLNIGTLIEPTTKAEYVAGSAQLPPKLFSHNDQQSVWQASNPEGATSGWGGRISDQFGDQFAAPDPATFTAISVSGNAVFLAGDSAVQYQVSTSGSVSISGIGPTLYGSRTAAEALREIIRGKPGDKPIFNNFESAYTKVVARSIDADVSLKRALLGKPVWTTAFPTTGLGPQLQMVADMISVREALGAKRQVFFVSLGGFDLHDNLLAEHPGLLEQVGDAMEAFDAAMDQLSVLEKVTTFTASEFGRTLTSNGDGSDHGWGSYHFVMGGAVKPKSYFGQAPVLGNDGPNDVGQGRMLPTMAVDQLAATLATWMGVPNNKLTDVVPGITNYPVQNLGLFR